jgi:hypothetical protein
MVLRPGGTYDSSPAIYRRVRKAHEARVPEARPNTVAHARRKALEFEDLETARTAYFRRIRYSTQSFQPFQERTIGTCYNWTIGRRFPCRTFDLAPLSGRVALGGRFPGLKPWAEFCSPCGAQNKGLSPRIVAYSPFGAKSS